MFFFFLHCQGVVQRSYNAYAVRVQDANQFGQPQTPGGGLGLGGLTHGSDKGAGTLKVIPAGQTTEGILCIEMRIRLYHDGAMSKILEKLAKVGWGGGLRDCVRRLLVVLFAVYLVRRVRSLARETCTFLALSRQLDELSFLWTWTFFFCLMFISAHGPACAAGPLQSQVHGPNKENPRENTVEVSSYPLADLSSVRSLLRA